MLEYMLLSPLSVYGVFLKIENLMKIILNEFSWKSISKQTTTSQTSNRNKMVRERDEAKKMKRTTTRRRSECLSNTFSEYGINMNDDDKRKSKKKILYINAYTHNIYE